MKRHMHYLLGPVVGTTAAFLCPEFYEKGKNVTRMNNCCQKNLDCELINFNTPDKIILINLIVHCPQRRYPKVSIFPAWYHYCLPVRPKNPLRYPHQEDSLCLNVTHHSEIALGPYRFLYWALYNNLCKNLLLDLFRPLHRDFLEQLPFNSFNSKTLNLFFIFCDKYLITDWTYLRFL